MSYDFVSLINNDGKTPDKPTYLTTYNSMLLDSDGKMIGRVQKLTVHIQAMLDGLTSYESCIIDGCVTNGTYERESSHFNCPVRLDVWHGNWHIKTLDEKRCLVSYVFFGDGPAPLEMPITGVSGIFIRMSINTRTAIDINLIRT